MLSIGKLYEIKRHTNELACDLFSRFLDTLIEIPTRFRPSEKMCINLFCEAYTPGLSQWSEDMKPQSIDQVMDWISIVEEVKIGCVYPTASHNVDSDFHNEERQKLTLPDPQGASVSGQLAIDCCHFIDSLKIDAPNSDEDEETECEVKEVISHYSPLHISSHDSTQEMHEIAQMHFSRINPVSPDSVDTFDVYDKAQVKSQRGEIESKKYIVEYGSSYGLEIESMASSSRYVNSLEGIFFLGSDQFSSCEEF